MADTPGSGWMQSVVDSTTDGLWVVEESGDIVWANAAMASLLGREPGDVLGMPTHLVFPHDQRAQVDRHLSMLRRGTRGRDNLPVTVEGVDGTVVPGLLSYSPVREQARTTGWLHRFTPYAGPGVAPPSAVTDLRHGEVTADAATRRLRLLQQLAMAASKAASLVEVIEVAALRLPEHTDWRFVAAWRLDPGGPPTRVHPPHGPGAPSALADRAARTAQVATEPRVLEGRTWTAITMPIAVAGDVAAVLEVLAAEFPLQESSAELVQQVSAQLEGVAERESAASELAEARDRAMEASRMKSEFLATMSHEIRTPMNGVIGLNELLLRTALDDHQRRLADGVHQSGLTLLTIINDILDLSKIEAGRLELEDVDFEVRSVFEQAASVLTGPAHEKGIELVVGCHPDVPEYLRGDPTRLGQVLTNLGSNAVKFTERGEVAILARVEHPDRVGDQGSNQGSDQGGERVLLRVEVTDTGIGIPASAQGTLFDAFTQADLATTRRHGGSGLGLAICQQLVSAMGGQIAVDSAPGRGSTFSFTAPLELTPRTHRHARPAPESLRGQRVLVLDDNRTNRLLLTEQLAAWQLEAFGVATPAECLSTLREAERAGRPFRMALIDLELPRIDGVELAGIIQADPSLADVTLVLLTSDHGVGQRAAREAGISATLSKPVRRSELHDAVLRAVGDPRECTPRPPRRLVVPSLDLKVLVVEDNPANQLVATGLLEALGVEVAVADDGEAAIAALHGEHGYALVLMDCRMPRVDGFAATRAIRAAEAPGTRVPIIAMTASVLEGERERCLDAGMDDFLTKPVDPTQLEEVVQRWTKQSGPASAAPGQAGASVLTSLTSLTDGPPAAGGLAVLDEERRLLLAELVKDGENFFDRTARSFLSRIDGHVRDLRTHLAVGDRHATFASSHLVKGSALNLGLARLSATAAEVEAHAHGGDLAGIEPKVVELEREVDAAVAELRRRLR